MILGLLQVHHDLGGKGFAQVLEVLPELSQLVLFLQVDLQSLPPSRFSLPNLRQTILEPGNQAFQLSLRLGFVRQFLGPLLVFVVDVDVVGL